MKKHILTVILFSTTIALTLGQIPDDAKRDYTWISGRPSWGGAFGGASGLKFNTEPPTIYSTYSAIDIPHDNGAICDSNGNLLFYCNGMEVADRTGHKMPHGDSINYGVQYVNYHYTGYPVAQGVIILPLPKNDSLYYIFHVKMNEGYFFEGLFRSTVNLHKNNDLGDVVEKNIQILNDTLAWGFLTACRHGNGRDWWILIPILNEHSYYRLLLDPEGLHVMGKQAIGSPFTKRKQWGNAAFSPDGTRYARCGDTMGLCPSRILDLFSFDRCTGFLSDYINLAFPDSTTGVSVAFSPNSNVLYFNTLINLYQFDLTSQDIPASRQHIASWNGIMYLGHYYTTFCFSQLGPDGRIYYAAEETIYMHVIEDPDNLGPACNFNQMAIAMPKMIQNPTNYPNFRLGRWIGSPCDVLIGTEELYEQKDGLLQIKTIPNPASDFINFELDVVNNFFPMKLEILDMNLRKMSTIDVSSFQGVVNVDVSSYCSGVYFAILTKCDRTVGHCKFAVIR